MSLSRMARQAGFAAAAVMMMVGGGTIAAQAMPVQSSLDAADASAAQTNVQTVQYYRDWRRERNWRGHERRRYLNQRGHYQRLQAHRYRAWQNRQWRRGFRSY